MAGPVGFVGRERELSRLRVALGGDTRLVLVVGDAGVGRVGGDGGVGRGGLAGEGRRGAAARGWGRRGGSCLLLPKKLPLLPTREARGDLSRLDGGGLRKARLGMVPPYVRTEVER